MIGVQVVTGSRYLGGFVGERETEGQWMQEIQQLGNEVDDTLPVLPSTEA